MAPEVKFLQQTNNWDCGAACLAMVTHHSVQHIHMLLKRDCSEEIPDLEGGHLGVHLDEICYLLWLHQMLHICFYPIEAFPPEDSRARFPEKIQMLSLKDLNEQIRIQGGKAILGIPSPRGGHWIVVENEMIYDPKMDKPYPWRQDQTLTIQCAVVIGPPLYERD